MKRIWGISFEDINSGGYIYRYTEIKNPFQKNDSWFVGLNEKFLRDTIEKGVHRLVLKVGEREIVVAPPNKKEIKRMNFEDIPSMFQNGQSMRVFHYKL